MLCHMWLTSLAAKCGVEPGGVRRANGSQSSRWFRPRFVLAYSRSDHFLPLDPCRLQYYRPGRCRSREFSCIVTDTLGLPSSIPSCSIADRPGRLTYARQLGATVTALGGSSSLLDVKDARLAARGLDDTGPVRGGVVAVGEDIQSVNAISSQSEARLRLIRDPRILTRYGVCKSHECRPFCRF